MSDEPTATMKDLSAKLEAMTSNSEEWFERMSTKITIVMDFVDVAKRVADGFAAMEVDYDYAESQILARDLIDAKKKYQAAIAALLG